MNATAISTRPPRVISIDALRGLVMFAMIFVNDLGEVPGDIVPPSMKHFLGKDGMTFVDLVFPAFLFIVGMSIPFALGSRLARGEPPWKTAGHILFRTGSLLFIGILMVNGRPDDAEMGWAGRLWCVWLYLSAIFAFGWLTPTHPLADEKRKKILARLSWTLRLAAFAALIYLTLQFRGAHGRKIISFEPFYIRHIWYGILGHIGWAYLVAALIYLGFRANRTALLACLGLLISLFVADRSGMFAGSWLSRQITIGTGLGSLPSIAVGGMLFVTILITPETAAARTRLRFTWWYVAGFALAGWLFKALYGVSKSDATPTWCFWSCAITAALWLLLYYFCDVRPAPALSRPLARAGQNVFLAYLISELFPQAVRYFGLNDWYQSLAGPTLLNAMARSAGCAFVILLLTVALNRAGFSSKL